MSDKQKENQESEVVNEEVLEDSTETVEEVKEEKKPSKRKKKKEDQLREEIISLQEELATTKNAYYKAYADTENLKKRLQSDADTLRKYRIQSFAQEILPAIDNLERAITFESDDEEVKKYVDGIQMIYQQIKGALEKEGVSEVESLNLPFDAQVHQALLTEAVEGVESGIVVEEIQKGYKLKDRILRASLVKVSE